jgi:predicted metal-dependent phosphoesterase TrpH
MIGDDTWGRADLHLHTLASDGLLSVPELLDEVEQATDLDVIAITDHDEIESSLEARELALREQYRFRVIPGVEVSTRDGHLLALFIEERPPALRPLLATAEWIVERGGLCVAPHPFTRLTHSLGARTLGPAVRAGLISGVEVLNTSLAGRGSREKAARYADLHLLAEVGSSDAHMSAMIGLARTRFQGCSPEDLRLALEAGTTRAEGRFASAREIASEAIPQLARSMVHLPIQRMLRYARIATMELAEREDQ